jgi:glyoxylase-like metal-dependent hydrolase (beta-lactamase superfamily II)
MQNFDYLVMDSDSKEAMAIDSGWETGPVVKIAKKEGMNVKYVVATHGHFDHVETLRELAQKLGAKLVVHEASELEADIRVEDGDIFHLGKSSVKVIHTPGHTPDSISLYDGQHVFTGDTLFIGNSGRTDLPGGSTAKLFHSLHEVLMKLPQGTVIYPGHDYGDVPSRAMGEEAKVNPTLLARDLREFTGVE